MEKSRPVYFLKENPPGWKRSSLRGLRAVAEELFVEGAQLREDLAQLSWSQRHEYLNALALSRQAERWEREVGIKPDTSAFTLLVPIHNEENSLPSFLHTLMLSDIPASVGIQVVFFTNACTDRSTELIRAFMAQLGEVECQELADDFGDQGMDRHSAVVCRGRHVYLHIDTATPGKAHALDVGNRIALRSGHLVAMSLDANNFIEPDALRKMFSIAYGVFREKPERDDVVLFSAVGRESLKDSRVKGLLRKIGRARHHLVEVGEGVVNGWMLAWNTTWMNDIGGPPEVALEDYALGVLARVKGFRIAQAAAVYVWGYVNNDFKGLFMTRARYVRGKLQILEHTQREPAILAIIEKEAFYMKRFTFRLKYLCASAATRPLHSGRYIATFLLWEYAIWRGTRDYKRDPKNQSWEKIASTY